MRFEKSENLFHLALTMQGTSEGLSLADIQNRLSVSRRTAERMRDALERIFPQIEQANPGETPKRWRIPSGTLNRLVGISPDELAELHNAIAILKRDNLTEQASILEGLSEKLKSASLSKDQRDLEFLLQTEGLAMRPGPRPVVKEGILPTLREAIISDRKVRLHYRSRDTGKLSRQIVCPYGFLYGNRHYLIAFNMNPIVRDYRPFSLSNIDKVDLTEWVFERREDFSLEEYAQKSFGVFQEKPFDVVWKFSPDVAKDAREFRFHPTEEKEDQPDGSLIVRFCAGGTKEMCWHLFTWGNEVEVLEPKKLAQRYSRMIS